MSTVRTQSIFRDSSAFTLPPPQGSAALLSPFADGPEFQHVGSRSTQRTATADTPWSSASPAQLSASHIDHAGSHRLSAQDLQWRLCDEEMETRWTINRMEEIKRLVAPPLFFHPSNSPFFSFNHTVWGVLSWKYPNAACLWCPARTCGSQRAPAHSLPRYKSQGRLSSPISTRFTSTRTHLLKSWKTRGKTPAARAIRASSGGPTSAFILARP